MNNTARIALNLSSTVFCSRSHGKLNYGMESRPTLIEIGDTEQMRMNLRNDACFKCQQSGNQYWNVNQSDHYSTPINDLILLKDPLEVA